MYKECMEKRCNMDKNKKKKSKCMEQVQSFTSMTGMFGSASFASSMQGVCNCVKSKSEQKKAMRQYATEIVNLYGSPAEQNNKTHMDELLKRYDGEKHGHLYFDLMMQYGHNP